MILFARDWIRFPTAIVDYLTPNKSFLRFAQLLKAMGVKNHAFMLALIQPELQGVDPHSETLTQEQKVMISLECRDNPWYFFREVVRLPPNASPSPIPLRANRGNIAAIWAFLCNIDLALIQPRQTGKSSSVDCVMNWLIYIGASNTDINLITKDDALRKKNVERLKAIRDYLPKYLVTITSKDADNQYELTCLAHTNTYKTAVAQNSESAANNLGRGLTSPIMQFDESPFISFIGTALPAALAAGTAAREEAEKYGRPYGNIFTTTAGKKDDRDGRFMYDMIHGGAVWSETYYDAPDRKTLHQMVKQNGSGRKTILNITMSHRQLGYTDEWLYAAISNANATGEAADRDFLNIWTSGSQRSPLTVALNETIHKSEMDIQFSEISPDNYIIRWYVPENEIAERMATGHYVFGLDTSEAVGRDTIALVMIDIRDLSTVAAGVYNETNLIRFAGYLAWLMIRYPNTTLVIERKSSAQMIIDYLTIKLPTVGIDPFKRMFNKVVDEQRESPEAFKQLATRLEMRGESFYDTRKASFGFFTNKDNRVLLYTTVLQNAAKKAGHLVRDRSLSSEIRGLVEKNGRIDHVSSGHDDMVIAWLLAHWFLAHGRNLSHYGINHSEVMSDVSDAGRKLTEKEVYEREEQSYYMEELEDILEKLKTIKDEMVIAKLEYRLRVLTNKLSNASLDETFSIDALIQNASEERLKQQRMLVREQRNTGNNYGYRPLMR